MVMMGDGHIYERIETMYVAEEYKVFLLTGQSQGGRRAFIAAKPFGSIDVDTLADLMTKAKPLDADSRIRLSADQQSLRMYDGFTGTISNFPLAELDADVRGKLMTGAGNVSTPDPWGKYTKLTGEAPVAGGKKVRGFSI